MARRALGSALGKCPKSKLFRGYIDLEIQLREFSRCRTLYEKFLEFNPENVQTWMKFAELETLLGDVERARALYELAINQPKLDMPEILWKAYIDFETEQEETDKARELYRRLLDRTQHVKVWLSYAQFELQVTQQIINCSLNESLPVCLLLLFTVGNTFLFSRWSMRIGFNRLATFMSKRTRSCAGETA